MFGLGTSAIILSLCTLLWFFGASRLPGLARGLGKGIRAFKDTMKDRSGASLQASVDR